MKSFTAVKITSGTSFKCTLVRETKCYYVVKVHGLYSNGNEPEIRFHKNTMHIEHLGLTLKEVCIDDLHAEALNENIVVDMAIDAQSKISDLESATHYHVATRTYFCCDGDEVSFFNPKESLWTTTTHLPDGCVKFAEVAEQPKSQAREVYDALSTEIATIGDETFSSIGVKVDEYLMNNNRNILESFNVVGSGLIYTFNDQSILNVTGNYDDYEIMLVVENEGQEPEPEQTDAEKLQQFASDTIEFRGYVKHQALCVLIIHEYEHADRLENWFINDKCAAFKMKDGSRMIAKKNGVALDLVSYSSGKPITHYSGARPSDIWLDECDDSFSAFDTGAAFHTAIEQGEYKLDGLEKKVKVTKLGKALRALRVAESMTLRDMAVTINMALISNNFSTADLSAIELGKKEVSQELSKAIKFIYNIDCEALEND